MPEANLEQQIERMKLAMDTYLNISQTNDRTEIINQVQILEKLGIIDELRMAKWLARYDSQKRDDSDVKEPVAHTVFDTLFKPKEKHKIKFLWLNVQLGQLLMDIYNKKVNRIKTSFFDEQEEYKISKNTGPNILQKESPLKNVFDLIDRGDEHNSYLFPNYLKSKRYYEKALNLLHKKEPFQSKPDLINFLNEMIDDSELKHKEWLKNYKKTKKQLKEIFPIDKDLSYQEYHDLYEKLQDFRDKTLLEFNHSKNYISGASLSAIKDYYSEFIKILKEEKSSPKIKEIISKVYAVSCTFAKNDIYYIKKALEFDRNNLDAHYRLAKYYERYTDENKALQNWSNFIKCYFNKTDKVKLKIFSYSTNQVGKIEDKNLKYDLFDKLIIKRSKDTVSKEYNLMKFLYNLKPNQKTVPKPIAHIQYKDGYNYLIMRETDVDFEEKSDDVRTLAETIDYINNLKFVKDLPKSKRLEWMSKKEILDKFKVEYLKKCLKNLVQIQETLNTFNLEKENYDFREIVKHKISKRLRGYSKLTESLEFLVEKIDHQEKCFSHGDYHSGNILIKRDKCIPIDFEYVSFMPLLYDAVFLLEDPKLNLAMDIKEELINFYLKNKGQNFDCKRKKDYDFISLFIALRWAGISSKWKDITNKEEYNQDKLVNLKKSEKIIDKMLAYTSGFEYSNLKKLKSCLKELY